MHDHVRICHEAERVFFDIAELKRLNPVCIMQDQLQVSKNSPSFLFLKHCSTHLSRSALYLSVAFIAFLVTNVTSGFSSP